MKKLTEILTEIQQPYVKLLNLIFPYIKKINEKWRDIIVEAALAMILFIPLYEAIFIYYTSMFKSHAVGTVLVFVFACVAVAFSQRDEIKPIRLNPVFVALLGLYVIALGIAFIVKFSEDGFQVQYLAWLVVYAAVLPMLFIVWANRGDLAKLYTMLTRPYAVVFTIYCGALPIINDWIKVGNDYRLCGYTYHPNTLANLLFTGFICCLYNLLNGGFTVFTGVYGLGFCLSGFMLMLTGSRTTMIAIAVSVVVLLVYTIVKKNRRVAVMLLAASAVFVICFALAKPFYINSVERIVASHAAENQGDEPQDIQDELAEYAAIEEYHNDRFSFFGKSLNTILSGRPMIWKNYAEKLNLFGAQAWRRMFEARRNGELMGKVSHAHNFFLEIAFLYGAAAGVLSMLIAVLALVYVGFLIFRKTPYEGNKIYVILAICAFCISAIPEYYGRPLETVVSLMYIFALVPAFCVVEAYSEDVTPESIESDA